MAAQQQREDPLKAMRTFLAEKPVEVQKKLDVWVAKQPAWVEGLVAGAKGSGQGLFLGLIMGAVGKMNMDGAVSSGAQLPPQMLNMGGPIVQARNFMVLTGVNAGVQAYMKRWRGGREDVQNQLVGGFFSGASYSFISAAPTPGTNPLMPAFSAGVVFALFQGAFFLLSEKFTGTKTVDTEYARVKAMLTSLNLAPYEKNLRKGLLNDTTIGLWDNAALQEVRIPAGPRLLIMAHIDQYRHILRPAMPIPKSLPQNY